MNMICKSVADNECGCTLYSGVHVCTRGGQMYRGHTSGSGSALTSAHNSEPESETDRETVRAGLISATGGVYCRRHSSIRNINCNYEPVNTNQKPIL